MPASASKLQFSSQQTSFVSDLAEAYCARHWDRYEPHLPLARRFDIGDNIQITDPLGLKGEVTAQVIRNVVFSKAEIASLSAGKVPDSIWVSHGMRGELQAVAAECLAENVPFNPEQSDFYRGAPLVEAEFQYDVDELSLRVLLEQAERTAERERVPIKLTAGRAVLHLKTFPVQVRGKVRCLVDGAAVRSLQWLEDLRQRHQASTSVESVAVVDHVLGSDESDMLDDAINQLRFAQEPDYHPGSEGRVRDIIHPSLYCFSAGQSKLCAAANPSQLATLSGDRSPLVRCLVAQNPRVTEEALEALARDGEALVRRAVAQNPACPGTVLTTLASDLDDEVRAAVRRNPNSPKSAVTRAEKPGARRFERKDEQGTRFWEISVSEMGYTVRTGAVGTSGRAKRSVFEDETEASINAIEHSWNARKRGFEEVRVTQDHSEDYDFWGRDWSSSGYRWLPSEVEGTPEGKATFVSTINTVDRERHAELYASLEGLLTATLPAFQKVMGGLRNRGYAALFGEDYWDWSSNNSHLSSPLPERSLYGRRLQVVVKIVDYELRGGIVHEGAWHVEGISDEGIVATAVHVLSCDKEIRGGTLLFSRQALSEEGNYLVGTLPQDPMPPLYDFANNARVPLGSVQTQANRTVVFPNSHIHRLDHLVADTPGISRRRVVVFWLIDRDRRILSTETVEPQERHITRKQALKNRLKLMKERTGLKRHFNDEMHVINLCEH